ncbi:unnamed protein product [Peniophora sp. CBMAI 1063]|nr:unnamed protein product [Peniophora sp. CBMAI 1063]
MVYTASSSHILNGSTYMINYRFERHSDARGIFDFSYDLQLLNAPPTSPPAALASGHVILRDHLGATRQWYAEMDIPSQETAELSYLFDARGRLLQEYISGLYLRGSGVWGHELSKGTILLVTELSVGESYRGRGMGTWLLNHVLSEPSVARPPATLRRMLHSPPAKCDFAIAWPAGIGGAGISPEQHRMQSEVAVRTFRGVGFRRIGRSLFFARSLKDPSHPSLSLLAQDDASEVSQPEASRPLPALSPFLCTLVQSDWSEIGRRLPLHSMIVSDNCSDSRIVDAISRLSTPAELAHVCVADPTAMNATPLHLAAMTSRASVVQKLLTTSARGNVFAATAHGRTPLDCLQRKMREEKAFASTVRMQSWSGHSAASIETQAALMAVMGRPAPSENAARWGCTCGECVLGWFSPAMFYQIHSEPIFVSIPIFTPTTIVQAELAADMQRDSLDSTEADETRGRTRLYKSPTLDYIHFMKYIPASICAQGVHATFIKGYGAVLRAIASVTKQNRIPTVQLISSQALQSRHDPFAARAADFFFQKGGTVEQALNGVLHAASEQGPGGDGPFLEMADLADDLLALPQCENDEDYALLRANLGIPADLQGPVSSAWSDDFMHADDFDDAMDTSSSGEDESEEGDY